MGKVRKRLISLQLHIRPLYLSTTKAPHKIDPSYVNHRQKIPSVFVGRFIEWDFIFIFWGHFADHFGKQNTPSLSTFWKMKQPLLRELWNTCFCFIFHFSWYLVGIHQVSRGGKKQMKTMPKLLCSVKPLVKPLTTCFTIIGPMLSSILLGPLFQ